MNTTQPQAVVLPKTLRNVQVRLPGHEYPQHVIVWDRAPGILAENIATGRTSNVTGVRRGDENEIRWTIRTLQRVAGKMGMADTYRFSIIDKPGEYDGDDGQWLLYVDGMTVGHIFYGILLAERRRRMGRKGYRDQLRRQEDRDARRRTRRNGGYVGSRRTGEYYVE